MAMIGVANSNVMISSENRSQSRPTIHRPVSGKSQRRSSGSTSQRAGIERRDVRRGNRRGIRRLIHIDRLGEVHRYFTLSYFRKRG